MAEKSTWSTQHGSKTSSEHEASLNYEPGKTTDAGDLVLVPRPTGSPKDPLTWSNRRKVRLLVLLCVAAFVGNASALAGQLAYPVQAKTYGVTAGQLAYSVSAATAGLAVGALLFIPLQNVFGRWSITFWSLLGQLGCAVWSARMTGRGDYIKFTISRLFSGLFGSVPSAVGGSMIIDMFYLHQRGRAFTCYELSVIFGATAGQTFSGFIASSTSWTVCFWYTVPLIAVTSIAVFLLAEETAFDRETELPNPVPDEFWKSRLSLFFFGTKAVSKHSTRSVASAFMLPIRIGLSPITLLCGLFTMITNGWNLMNHILSPLFLQTPVSQGGYGFSAAQNASFHFSIWVALALSQIVGHLLHDRLPMAICRRFYNGIWRPEYRLYIILWTVIFTPVGLGIAGAALSKHYDFIVYAFAYSFTSFSVSMTVPVITNYVTECFPGYGSETTLLLTFYRLIWGVVIPFFIGSWKESVGINWVYGTAAFITIACWFLIQAILWKGPYLRSLSLIQAGKRGEDSKILYTKREIH